MPDPSKAGTVECDGDKVITYDAHGNKHVKLHLDYGVIAAKLGMPAAPTVKVGPNLVTFADGSVHACKEATFAPPVKILEENEYFLRLRVKRPAGFEELKVMFPTYAERVRVAEELRTKLRAEG